MVYVIRLIVFFSYVLCFYLATLCSAPFTLFFFKQKTAYEMRISDWSSDVCSSDLNVIPTHASIPSGIPSGFPDDSRPSMIRGFDPKIGRASCRERVCQYV